MRRPSPTREPNSCRGPDSRPSPGCSSGSGLCPGLGEGVFWGSGCDLGTDSQPDPNICPGPVFHSGAGSGWGFGFRPESGVKALMLGAAAWQDRQGTTVDSDESPRKRPQQPPPRHRAAAFPIEPATRAPSAERGRAGGRGQEAEAGAGLGGDSAGARRRRWRARGAPRAAQPHAARRVAVVLFALSGRDSDPGRSLASPAPR